MASRSSPRRERLGRAVSGLFVSSGIGRELIGQLPPSCHPPEPTGRPRSAERDLPVTSTAAATLAEIRSVMAELPGPNTVAGAPSRRAPSPWTIDPCRNPPSLELGLQGDLEAARHVIFERVGPAAFG